MVVVVAIVLVVLVVVVVVVEVGASPKLVGAPEAKEITKSNATNA